MVVHYKNIGSFRFLLAFLVLTSHSGGYLPTYIHQLFLGNIGVLVFFIVSGYVIAESCELFYQNKFKNFIFNRFMKLYPTYLLTILICYLLASFVNLSNAIGQINYDVKSIFANITLLPTYLKLFNNLNFLGQTWALIVEFQFYILYGLFVTKIKNKSLKTIISYTLIVIALYILVFKKYNYFYSSIYFSPFFIFGVMSYKCSIKNSKFNIIGMYSCLILSIVFLTSKNLQLMINHITIMIIIFKNT